MNKIYLLAGVPASGKSWICEQLKDQFDHVAHDDYIGAHHDSRYVNALARMRDLATKPILAETPFSISKILDPLTALGFDVEVVFIIERPEILVNRYLERGGVAYSKGNFTRQETYATRAQEWNCFSGNSSEVLEYLQKRGLVIREKDGSASNIIRFGPETALRIGLKAIEKHLATAQEAGPEKK